VGTVAMSRELSNEFLSELYSQESGDPFLSLFTISHSSFDTLYLVNNTESITSNGQVFTPFPVTLVLPPDDGETARNVDIVFDNVSQLLIDELRAVTDLIDVRIDMVLASNPDDIEVSLGELKIKNIDYNAKQIRGTLIMDDFLSTELTSEKYTPTLYPGIFS
jgi:hypothetical protein